MSASELPHETRETYQKVHEDRVPNRILLVEDDLKLARLVSEFLSKHDYVVTCEHRGDRALAMIAELSPDLVVLDLMLPGKDGISICREARATYGGPILMLTARGEELDEVLGLEVGADDYLKKPVRPRVLLARIRSLLRRAGSDLGDAKRLELGALVVNAATRAVTLQGIAVELTSSEFDVMWTLAQHAGTPLSREELSLATRGIAYDGVDRTIDLRISSLRTKLGDTGKPPTLIKSVRGVGYQLAVEQ